MKAINSKLEIHDVRIPNLKPGQALVKVICYGITPDDVEIQNAQGVHSLLGTEFSGIIKLVDNPQENSDYAQFKEGVRVLGYSVSGGSMAEYIACDMSTLAEIPSGLSFVEAASIPDMWFTALQLFKGDVNFQKRDYTIIYNGMSSRGQASVKLSQILGCRRVHCVVNSDYANEIAETHLKLHGALPDELVIHLNNDNVLYEVEKYNPSGLHSAIYLGDYPDKVYSKMMLPGGCIAISPTCYKAPNDSKAPFDDSKQFEMFIVKGLRLVGSNIRGKSPQSLATHRDFLVTHILPKIRNKKLSVHIEQTFDWENTSEAIEYVRMHPESKGKVVCVVDHSVF